MPTIGCRYVRKPRKPSGCDACRRAPDLASRVVLFGFAETGDKPYELRFCIGCSRDSRDPKIRALLEQPEVSG